MARKGKRHITDKGSKLRAIRSRMEENEEQSERKPGRRKRRAGKY